MEKTQRDVDAHIGSLPDQYRASIEYLDKTISEIMVGQGRVLWEGSLWGGTQQEIIGYGDYTTGRSGGGTSHWFKVGLALQKNYISIYVNAVEGRQYVAEKYRSTLGKVKVGKSSISLKRLDDLNVETLKKIISIAYEQCTA